MEQFRDARKVCRDAEERRREGDPQSGSSSLYSPLNLGTRVNKGLLEVYWFEQHKGKRTGNMAYRYIPRGKTKGHGYHVTQLLKHAKPYERELVQQTEAVATDLRGRRAALADLRRDLHKVIALYRTRVAQAGEARQGRGDAADASPLVRAQEPGYT